MGYIKLFNNTAAYQDYMNGEPLLPNVSLVEEDESIFYTPVFDYSKEYMYIKALEDGLTISFTKNATSGSLYYSLDKQEWNELTGETPIVNSGEKVYFKGADLFSTANGIGTFAINKQCNVAGNVMSLLFADDFVGKTDLTGHNYAFFNLFKNCTTTQSAKNLKLPAITLANSCYYSMFQGCSSLTTAPALPTTALAPNCYLYMFADCTSLTTTSELPATMLTSGCYLGMFRNCSSLTSTPELPATTLAGNCYLGMFSGCSSLTSTPELPATTLASGCYNTMFAFCTSLTTAPELPATTLANSCYPGMFQGCSSLTTAQSILPATVLAEGCYSGMFNGCTNLTTAPELPATILSASCYGSMFYGCTSLNHIKMLATNISASGCLSGWVNGVSSTGTFVKAEGVEIPTGDSGIPSGWTVQVA